jgi:hypothetical protein
MKLHRLLILSGLLIGAAPAVSFAECRPACSGTDVCRITSQGPPTVYACLAPPAKKELRNPGVMQPGAGAPRGGGASGSNARTVGPTVGPRPSAAHKEHIEVASVKSPRDAATGQVKGKGESRGVTEAGQEKQSGIKKP